MLVNRLLSIAMGTIVLAGWIPINAFGHVIAHGKTAFGENGRSGDPNASSDDRHLVNGIRSVSGRSAVVYTSTALYFTTDGGSRWQRITLPLGKAETIAEVGEANGRLMAVVADASNLIVSIALAGDDMLTWERAALRLPEFGSIGAATDSTKFDVSSSGLVLRFRVQTSSNFSGVAEYRSNDLVRGWELASVTVSPGNGSGALTEADTGDWNLSSEGECFGNKTGCYLRSAVYFAGKDVTPPEVARLASDAREEAMAEAFGSPMFSAPPGGSTRISLNRGFDKCTAAPSSQMQTWWNTSWFHDANIYMSGRNRGCSQPQLTAAWVDQVSAMGWGLIPTVVGFQSPCSVCATCQKHSFDTAIAESQGRGEADIAVTDANNLGLTQGSILYYDMERYDETAQTPGCRAATTAFLKGWTDRIKELGYKSGVYGSPTNAVNDWIGIPEPSRMDAVWLARWDNIMSVWTFAAPSPVVPTNVWNNHQRIKQWQAPHDETWGGVTFNIDGNIADGPVAGPAIAKNAAADFDGDQKSDISVFRPETGVWYVLNSTNGGFSAIGFGVATDILTPGDYDGDGKTDRAVFRPSNGTWHFLLKGFNYSVRQFGIDGDIPAPADYNGDGKTDVAVFRPSTGVWYIANSDSQGTFTILHFGLTGDKPVKGDFDGDGRADIAVYRPSNGVWYVLRSSDGGFSAAAFGIATDLPSQGDFDGDGKTDLAVYRDGQWYLLQTTAGFSSFPFGIAGDVPSTGDHDGDGRADVAVYRPSTGIWYLLQSQAGFAAAQFGIATDRSVPNAYLPAQ